MFTIIITMTLTKDLVFMQSTPQEDYQPNRTLLYFPGTASLDTESPPPRYYPHLSSCHKSTAIHTPHLHTHIPCPHMSARTNQPS